MVIIHKKLLFLGKRFSCSDCIWLKSAVSLAYLKFTIKSILIVLFLVKKNPLYAEDKYFVQVVVMCVAYAQTTWTC